MNLLVSMGVSLMVPSMTRIASFCALFSFSRFVCASVVRSNHNSVNLHTWRSGGSVQSDSIFLLKPPKLSFPLLFSPGLITIMLSLLALLRFSLIQFKE